jgi:hypothetical protein
LRFPPGQIFCDAIHEFGAACGWYYPNDTDLSQFKKKLNDAFEEGFTAAKIKVLFWELFGVNLLSRCTLNGSTSICGLASGWGGIRRSVVHYFE